MLKYLNYYITQSETFATINQNEYAFKMTKKYFSRAPFTKTDIPFRIDRNVEDKIANAQPCR